MKYDLKIVICVLSVDFYKEETYILSESDNKIIMQRNMDGLNKLYQNKQQGVQVQSAY
mgnify:CR=1 FL=1